MEDGAEIENNFDDTPPIPDENDEFLAADDEDDDSQNEEEPLAQESESEELEEDDVPPPPMEEEVSVSGDEDEASESDSSAADADSDEAERLLGDIMGGKDLSKQSPEDIVASIMRMRKERDERRRKSLSTASSKMGSSIASAFMPSASADAGASQKTPTKEKTGEELMSDGECKSLAKKQVNYFVPRGQYFRVIKDKFFDQQRKFFTFFRSSTEHGNYMRSFVSSYDGKLGGAPYGISYVNIGWSAEGMAIRGVKFGNPRRGRHIIVVGALKGCDWTSPTAIMYAAVALMGRHINMDKLLEAVEFHFFPIINPEGMTYSRRKEPKSAKHWCKNRRVVGGGHGVQLENNFGVDGTSWGFGKKKNKDDTYQGPAPFSERETRSLRDYIKFYSSGLGRVSVLHIKCCKGTVYSPIPYNRNNTLMSTKLYEKAGAKIANEMKSYDNNEYGLKIRVPPFSEHDTGSLIDWSSNEAGALHSYVLELNVKGLATRTNRFVLNEDPLISAVGELERGIITAAKLLLNLPNKGSPTPGAFVPTNTLPPKTSSGKKSKKKKKKKPK